MVVVSMLWYVVQNMQVFVHTKFPFVWSTSWSDHVLSNSLLKPLTHCSTCIVNLFTRSFFNFRQSVKPQVVFAGKIETRIWTSNGICHVWIQWEIAFSKVHMGAHVPSRVVKFFGTDIAYPRYQRPVFCTLLAKVACRDNFLGRPSIFFGDVSIVFVWSQYMLVPIRLCEVIFTQSTLILSLSRYPLKWVTWKFPHRLLAVWVEALVRHTRVWQIVTVNEWFDCNALHHLGYFIDTCLHLILLQVSSKIAHTGKVRHAWSFCLDLIPYWGFEHRSVDLGFVPLGRGPIRLTD